jgi:glyoxylase-like metal-dependent hydrolase (beta-lactamase superfamily II)
MSKSTLNWKLLTKKRTSATPGIPPGMEHLAWVTNTVALICGKHDAVLVDTFLSEQHSRELAEWIAESHKNLTTIYITHGHGDHCFGVQQLLDRFPNARAIATGPVVLAIREQIRPEYVRTFWDRRFPGQIPSRLIAPEILDGDMFTLEGEELRVLEFGHTDTKHSTGLYVAALGLVVSGDAVYNNTHPYLAEFNDAAGRDWLRALDEIESLNPTAVVAGHGVVDPDSSPRHIEETRRYLLDFIKTRASTSTAKDLYEIMLSLYPDRVNPGSLWAAANAAKPAGQPNPDATLERNARSAT